MLRCGPTRGPRIGTPDTHPFETPQEKRNDPAQFPVPARWHARPVHRITTCQGLVMLIGESVEVSSQRIDLCFSRQGHDFSAAPPMR